jgi:hypothetical protein
MNHVKTNERQLPGEAVREQPVVHVSRARIIKTSTSHISHSKTCFQEILRDINIIFGQAPVGLEQLLDLHVNIYFTAGFRIPRVYVLIIQSHAT